MMVLDHRYVLIIKLVAFRWTTIGRFLRHPGAVLIYPNTSANRLRTSRSRLLPEFAKCYRRHCHRTLGHWRQDGWGLTRSILIGDTMILLCHDSRIRIRWQPTPGRPLGHLGRSCWQVRRQPMASRPAAWITGCSGGAANRWVSDGLPGW